VGSKQKSSVVPGQKHTCSNCCNKYSFNCYYSKWKSKLELEKFYKIKKNPKPTYHENILKRKHIKIKHYFPQQDILDILKGNEKKNQNSVSVYRTVCNTAEEVALTTINRSIYFGLTCC